MAMEQRQRRRPLTRQEQLALQERKQRRREKMEESRELARGPIDVTFLPAGAAADGHRPCDAAVRQLSLRLL